MYDEIQFLLQNCINTTAGYLVEEFLKHPKKTYPAHRWAKVINNGYLAFWDSEFERNEFMITDIGMTSENEKGWNGVTVHNRKKTDFLASLLLQEHDQAMQKEIAKCLIMHSCFSENFMMFPISARRMIVEIDPFYKFRQAYSWRYSMPSLSSLTELVNENLYYPNEAEYVLPQTETAVPGDGDSHRRTGSISAQICALRLLERLRYAVDTR